MALHWDVNFCIVLSYLISSTINALRLVREKKNPEVKKVYINTKKASNPVRFIRGRSNCLDRSCKVSASRALALQM